MAFESVAALSEILKNYGECVKEQDITRRKWCRSIDEWVEEAKRQVEEQASRPENETLEVGGQARSHGGESEEVVADVMLQHKERILDEVPTTDDVWYWQAELWAKRCKICRIREGVGRRHDWRVCPKYPGDCDVVRKVHMEVKIGTGMLENVGQMNGYCKGCNLMKQGCWMQLKDSAHHTGCRYKGVVDGFRAEWLERLKGLAECKKGLESLVERRMSYGVWNGEIGGRVETVEVVEVVEEKTEADEGTGSGFVEIKRGDEEEAMMMSRAEDEDGKDKD